MTHGEAPTPQKLGGAVWRRKPYHLPLLAALVLAATSVALPGHVGATVPPFTSWAAVVNFRLQAQVDNLVHSGHFLADRHAPLVRLEVTSSRDVSPDIRRLGGRIKADVAGRVIAAQLPAGAVDTLARQSGVTALFPVGKQYQELDRSVPDIRANQVWTLQDHGGLPIRGSHVLVGIVDGGTDYHSPDFKRADGSTRIKYIWDQTASGRAPAGFNFGYECDAASINSGACPERDDIDGHGTHVTGVAAGNGLSSNPPREIGVAPDADIIIVKSDLTTDDIMAAWQYLVSKAQQLHEPIVINNSFGDQEGPHDGSEPEDQALNRLAGPGRIFVKSAGNAGFSRAHLSGTLPARQSRSLAFTATGYNDQAGLAMFYSAQDSFTATLTDLSTGQTFHAVAQDGSLSGRRSRDGKTAITVESGQWNSRYHELFVAVKTTSRRALRDDFRLTIHGTRIRAGGRYGAWMLGEEDARFQGGNGSETLSIPGDAQNVITVGNYATKTSWTDAGGRVHSVCDFYPCNGGHLNVGDIALSSSRGPTADGRQKPDLSAPGTMITSTLSHDAPVCSSELQTNCIDPTLVTPDGRNFTETGTSMSAPHVTGTVALMLQVNPVLDQRAVTAILRSTARHDQFTGSAAWSPAFGAGKLDALAAVQNVLGSPLTPPIDPVVSPTASVPVPASPVAFRLVGVRAETSNGGPIQRTSAGRPVNLAIYARFSRLPDNARILVEWKVTQGSAVVGYNTLRRVLNHTETGTSRWVWRFVPRRAGKYVFVAHVTTEGISKAGSVVLTVR